MRAMPSVAAAALSIAATPTFAKADSRGILGRVQALLQHDDAASRPVVFAFNGGPGASSTALAFGFLAPGKP